jgi:hypothetical protein
MLNQKLLTAASPSCESCSFCPRVLRFDANRSTVKKRTRTGCVLPRILPRLILLGVTAVTLASAAETSLEVAVQGDSPGRVFEGLGALSAGASSRLLREYPEPQRSQILDFLFKPNFGSSWHHLKVEIGGDVNSTDGTEPSHARTREEFEHPTRQHFDRGYEWWLMREAKKRNPKIFLDILQWGAPGWIGDRSSGDADRAALNWEEIKKRNRLKFYTQDNADFVASFIRGAKRYHGLDIDFCGIWNETAYDIPWTKLLRKTLNAQGLQRVRIIAADHTGAKPWEPAKDILTDPDLSAAVYAIGAHYSGMTRKSEPEDPAYNSIPEAIETGKSLWSSEDGPWRGDWVGAAQLARIYNRNYIRGKMTKTVIWSLITSYYESLPLPNSGPMKASAPWSGYYQVQPATWAIAHTTQFAHPGWRYLDSACRLLPEDSGSCVALRAPGKSGDYSLIIETTDAKSTQRVTLKIDGELSRKPLHVWRSTEQRQFQRLPDVKVERGRVSLTLDPGAIYSLTTTRGQHKGEATPPAQAAFPFPYTDDFDSVKPGYYARYLSDQGGVFEVAKRADGKGRCLRQTVERRGIDWNGHPNPEPYTVIGSLNWRNYEIACDVLVEKSGYAALFCRIAHCPQQASPPQGTWLKVDTSGRWEILRHTKLLASGEASFSPNQWHAVVLQCLGSNLVAHVDGREIGRAVDPQPGSGMAALGCGVHGAQFDNLSIRPVPGHESEELSNLPNLAEGKKVTASSIWDPGFAASFACDGDPGTRWNSAPGDLAGSWIEVDFEKPTRFDTISVRQFAPRIAQYKFQCSGETGWRDIVTGDTTGQDSWQVQFPPATANKLRLLVVTTQGNNPQNSTPSIFELEVFDTKAEPR